MMILVLILSMVVAALWHRVQTLTARLDSLEFAGVTDGSTWSIPPDRIAAGEAAASVPKPDPVVEPRLIAPLERPDPIRAAPSAIISPVETPMVAPVTEEATAATPRAGFEDVFGRRLPIWAGGVTLAVAGFLVVRYSIEAGLLSPAVRIVLGLVFGSALIGAAEAALRREAMVGDPRVRQALAGAGIATLYGSVLAAANLYALVGSGTAFVGLAIVTVLASVLSLRFGAPSAVLGLVGGLAAPALVGATQTNVPLLTLYLALAVGGLCALGRQQRWWWLGAAAIVGGFGWGAMLIAGGAMDLADGAAVGFYTLALAVVLPLIVEGGQSGVVRLAGGLLGCAQLAALVALGGFTPLHWALFGLLTAALMWLSRREALLADVPILAFGVAVLLMLVWPAPGGVELALVLGGAALIVGVATARRVWRDDARATDAPLLAMLALATGLVPIVHDDMTGMPALIGAAGAAIVAGRGWRVAERHDDARFSTLALAAGFLVALAGLWTLPGWAWAPAVALVAVALHHVGGAGEDPRVTRGGWAFIAVATALLGGGSGLARLFGMGAAGAATALLSWSVPALVVAAMAFDRRTSAVVARMFGALAALLSYGAAAQIVPAGWLPLVPAMMMLALAATRRDDLTLMLIATGLVSLGWAAEPLVRWLGQAAFAAGGVFVPVGEWPPLADAGLRLALPAGAAVLAPRLLRQGERTRNALTTAGSIGLLVTMHLIVKHLFAIDTMSRFVALTLPERFCWELLLAVIAVVAWRLDARRVAVAFGAGALLHAAWFTGVVANPLVVAQDVGPWLVSEYLLVGALLWAMSVVMPDRTLLRDRMAMALAIVAGFTLLRQASHAPMVLADGTGTGEQMARSVLALMLAGGFLWVGIRRNAREWRLASLALMLVAVAKVFLHDAAGLDGLARIASFAALGFSLIGVGWLYSRYLPAQDRS